MDLYVANRCGESLWVCMGGGDNIMLPPTVLGRSPCRSRNKARRLKLAVAEFTIKC